MFHEKDNTFRNGTLHAFGSLKKNFFFLVHFHSWDQKS